jgi:hypothetical protein
LRGTLVNGTIPYRESYKGTTNLVSGLVQLLGVDRSAETESNAIAEEDVVREGNDTTVVDLGL